MKYDKIKVENGMAIIVNPYKELQDHGPGHFSNMLKNFDWEQFEEWLSAQSPIYADPSIKDGVYKVDELEIVWQLKWPTMDWINVADWVYSGFDHDFKAFSVQQDSETRQYATLKQPVKQEEKLAGEDVSLRKLIERYERFLNKHVQGWKLEIYKSEYDEQTK